MAQPAAALLMRHAHADWPHYHGSDFDRPLTPRGEQDARRAGAAIRAAGHAPALLLASAAHRTRQTAQIIAAELAIAHSRLLLEEALYNSSAAVLLARLQRATQETAGLVMLVAHNPGISQLARELSKPAAMDAFAPADWRLVRFP